MEIVDVTGEAREKGLARAVEALRAGLLVGLPTDTVYGVAADAFDTQATGRLFAAKQRPQTVPLPVFVRSPKQLIGLTPQIPAVADLLMAAFWPGPLTLVVPVEQHLRWQIGETAGSVSVRMPLDDIALDVVRAVGPLAVTAANAPGGVPPRSAREAAEQLGDELALVLDAGPRTAGLSSTVVDLTRITPRVLRVGAIDETLVLAVALGELDPIEAASRAAASFPGRPSGEGSGAGGDPAAEDGPGDAIEAEG